MGNFVEGAIRLREGAAGVAVAGGMSEGRCNVVIP